jgi:hypothetical protein
VAQRPNASSPRFVAVSPDDGTAIDLRNPALAAVLSWLVPGLGQLYQGRSFKGAVCMAGLVGTLVAGLWIGGGSVVYASWRPTDKRWAFLGQAGIGAVAIPAVVQSARVSGAAGQPFGQAGWFAPPLVRGQKVSETYRQRIIDRDPDIGREDFQGLTFMPRQPGDQLSLWHRRLGRFFDIGTLYTLLAGLLNVLVIYDAWAGPMRQPADPGAEKKLPASGSQRGQ